VPASPTVQSRVWRNGVLEAENFPFAQISDYLEQSDCLVWVDLCDPDHHRLLELADELSLDPLAVEDAISHGERAKATRYSTHTFLTAYAVALGGDAAQEEADETGDPHAGAEPGDDPGRLQLARISAFVLPNGMVTVRLGERFDVNAMVQRWDDNSDLLKFGVGALVHGMLDLIVDSHFDAVQAMDDQIEAVEDLLFDDRALNTAVQRQTYGIRKNLVELRRVVLPMREMVNAVQRNRHDNNSPAELDAWYTDLYDHVLRASEWTESLRDMVTSIFETNLSLQDARLNNIMKKLTSWAAIIAVPTAVTGFYGQNVPYPGFGHESGFVVSLLVMIGIAGGLYLAFRRKQWL
jgi:magnesium transporter